MIILRPTNLHWLDGGADSPGDLCAHSGVEFRIDDDLLVDPNADVWTVSAAALFLLRTLSQPRIKSTENEHLFPHCGHTMYAIEGEDDVLILGCWSGIDFEVIRAADEVAITAADGPEHRVRFAEWREAVCAFSDAVQSFYATSSPKQPFDEMEAEGFEKFMEEWLRRRALAAAV